MVVRACSPASHARKKKMMGLRNTLRKETRIEYPKFDLKKGLVQERGFSLGAR
jgi:hypothetical protein